MSLISESAAACEIDSEILRAGRGEDCRDVLATGESVIKDDYITVSVP
jgi:hypothetical protein